MRNSENGRMGFERSYEGEKTVEELQEFYTKYLLKAIEKNQIDEDDFVKQDEQDINLYTQEEVDADHKKVELKKQIFQANDKKNNRSPETKEKLRILAKLIEVLCSDHSILFRAFGAHKGDIAAQLACDYDDIENFIDIVLEYPAERKIDSDENTSIEAIGIDITISKEACEKKFITFRDQLDRNVSLNRVKYFEESSHLLPVGQEPHKGEHYLPRFIVNISSSELYRLIPQWQEWCDNVNSLSGDYEKQKFLEKTRLIDSPIWYQLSHQMIMQASQLSKFYETNVPEFAAEYRNAYIILRKYHEKLVSGYIQRNNEWYDKLIEIQTEKDITVRKARMQYLREQVHRILKGDNMGSFTRACSESFPLKKE
ncbi:MAG: hypothetical protein M3Q64_00905 [bacterium]|nr:hypothetical protein [bacterium]